MGILSSLGYSRFCELFWVQDEILCWDEGFPLTQLNPGLNRSVPVNDSSPELLAGTAPISAPCRVSHLSLHICVTVSSNSSPALNKNPLSCLCILRHPCTLLISHSLVTLRPNVPPISLTWRCFQWPGEVCSQVRQMCILHPLHSVQPFPRSTEDKAPGALLGSWWRTHQELHQALKTASALLCKTNTEERLWLLLWDKTLQCLYQDPTASAGTARAGGEFTAAGVGKFQLHLSFSSSSLLIAGSYCRSHSQLRIRLDVWQHFGIDWPLLAPLPSFTHSCWECTKGCITHKVRYTGSSKLPHRTGTPSFSLLLCCAGFS